MKIGVAGAGAWGTALGLVLHQNGHEVLLWGHDPDNLESIRKTGRNDRYLPGIPLPSSLQTESSLQRFQSRIEACVVAVPSKAFREVVSQLAGFPGIIVTVTKGIEFDTGLTMSGVLRQVAPRCRAAALSGPTLALEVARGVPSAIVSASDDPGVALQVQNWFHRPTFRVYTSSDMLGVELGGALKNVIAIGAGVCDGLGFGDNAKAALITRGIVEIRRLGVACGAQPDTFAGLSGLGDLTVTCFSKLSRNRTLGERLGSGEALSDILARSVSVAEGYPTSRSARQLAHKLKIDAPITEEVYAMLHEGKDVKQAVRDLLERDSKAETE